MEVRLLSIREIREALGRARHRLEAFEPHPHQAAVAMILADAPRGLDVCFIRRAERAGDPWSGQVAFPGGRASRADPDPFAVAERETWEEIGMRLERRHCIGGLPMRRVERNAQRSSFTLWPFVYHVGAGQQAMATVRLPREVASVFWVPIGHLFDAGAVTELAWRDATFPGIQFGEHVIWGLTLGVLASFAELMRRPLPALARTQIS